MNLRTMAAVFLALAVLVPGNAPGARAEIQLPRAGQTNADEKTLHEFEVFYEQIEEALKNKNITRMMSFYADDYLYHGITKRQLKFMWLEIFSDYTDPYSVHVFTKIEIHGSDAILICTGALFGIAGDEKDYQTVDRWVTTPHWLTKVDGAWKMIGGATHEAPSRRGSGLELHPLF